ncbi:MAG: YeeE/YedE thiosulfate transporter family protein [Halieaceae bacterium]|nr:YeeE/YedE thiosulfate transporter family protein [Halieaceae bacterium]
MLVFGMLVGGGITAPVFANKQPEMDKGSMPSLWKEQFGPSKLKRNLASFGGGILLLFGARLAGGCTSGHMISGISQMAISSFIFGAVTFAVAIATAKFLYRKRGA